eukprot:1768948-Rhodomonas_salina.1
MTPSQYQEPQVSTSRLEISTRMPRCPQSVPDTADRTVGNMDLNQYRTPRSSIAGRAGCYLPLLQKLLQ